MQRFGRPRHYLDSQAQSEQAAASNDIVPCGFLCPLAGNWQVGGTLGRVVLPAGQSNMPLRPFLLPYYSSHLQSRC